MSDGFIRLNEAADKHKKLDAEILEVSGQEVYQLRMLLANAGEVGKAPEALVYEEAGGGITYVGTAATGASLSAPVWRIKQLLTIPGGIRILWADGNSEFDNVWADRASLTYI